MAFPSSDSEDVLDVPSRPKLNPISTITFNSHKRMRPDSSTDSNMESSDGYELSTNSFSSMEEKRKAKYVKAGEGTSRSAMGHGLLSKVGKTL